MLANGTTQELAARRADAVTMCHGHVGDGLYLAAMIHISCNFRLGLDLPPVPIVTSAQMQNASSLSARHVTLSAANLPCLANVA